MSIAPFGTEWVIMLSRTVILGGSCRGRCRNSLGCSPWLHPRHSEESSPVVQSERNPSASCPLHTPAHRTSRRDGWNHERHLGAHLPPGLPRSHLWSKTNVSRWVESESLPWVPLTQLILSHHRFKRVKICVKLFDLHPLKSQERWKEIEEERKRKYQIAWYTIYT